jgi:hypothetical protein
MAQLGASMKTVYYIIAPTCSGKTTMALRLGTRMNLPVFHADTVYDLLHDTYSLPVPAERLFDPEEVRKLNLSWGEYSSMDEAKRPLYAELIKTADSDFIIEGFSLSFSHDRNLVAEAVGPHRVVILRIDLAFDKWCELYLKKMGKDGSHLLDAYNRIRAFFQPQEGDTVYSFKDPNALDVHYSPYQVAGFTDKKIAALQIPIEVGDTVNDIGCNEGQIGRWCLDNGASLVRGYDNHWRFLDKASQSGLQVHLSDVEADDRQPADVNLCVSVFHYFKNPQAFIQKIRARTNRLFVLELPIYEQPGLVSQYIPQTRSTKYSTSLIELWLKEHFAKVHRVGESIPPDKSFRLVYHCGV